MPKLAHTSIPVHEYIAERWSPRSFDETAVLDQDHLIAMLEAARWAPSANNMQPWRFAVALRGSDEFEAVFHALMPGNQTWAHRASALIVAAADSQTPRGTPNPWASYDVGLAVSLLTVQAHVMSLHVHQMGGFDKEAISQLFELPAHIAPLVVLAIGTLGEAEQLTEGPLRDREVSVRERKPLEEIVLSGL
jgi:nitroreductase